MHALRSIFETDAILANDCEAGHGFREDGIGDDVIAAEETVELPREFQHPGLTERAAFKDNFVALGVEQLVMRAGSVLVARGGEENAFGHAQDGAGTRPLGNEKCGARGETG